MELLPIRTSRHQMDASFTEQLLEGSANDFQYRQQQQRRRRHRPRHGDGPIIYATPVSQYQPPDGGRQESDNSVADLEPYLFFNEGPRPPSLRRALQQQKPSIGPAHRTKLNEDLAGSFSYGCCCCQCVRTQEVGITEDCGSFQRIIPPGFYCLAWPCYDIAGRLSLRIQQADIMCETKTKDNVFCHIQICVQYKVVVAHAYDAYYRLTDPTVQLDSLVFDVVRALVPKMTVDQLFLSKATIADSVHTRICAVMYDYGYEIIATLITNVSPCKTVRDAMNEMEASRRRKLAMPHIANAEKIRIIKQAEANAESMYLHGIGTANQRRAIVEGMQHCVIQLAENRSTKDVMDLLLLTQYMDILSAVGANDLIISHSPGNVQSLLQSLPTTHNIVDLLT